ncbi:hypothetical protein FB451DRAFT_1367809 [Mycena latifolia]|nr:hypothetical protein FB451DRAFT_1367809 [Mycena latifolia]
MQTVSPRPVFHLLPHDILYDLFALAASAVQDGDPYFATVLSHVCASWRATALATPPIWKNILIQARSDNCQNLEAKLYHERAAGMPIALVFRVHDVDGPITCPRVLPELLDGNRIYYLQVEAPEWELATAFMGFVARLSAKMSSLGSLNLTVLPNKMEFELTRPEHTPFHAPVWCIERSRFLWDQWDTSKMTSLIFEGLEDSPSLDCMRGILAGCQSTLNIFVFKGRAPDLSSTPVSVTLPALQVLRISYYNEISDLAQLVHAPNLAVLELADMFAHDFPGASATDEHLLLEALLPSCANLVVLSLAGLAGCHLVDTFYEHMRHLVNLSLRGTGPAYEDALFQIAAQHEGGRVAFPQLRELAISYTCPAGLAALLSRHLLVPWVPALECLQISDRQWAEAYAEEGSPLGMGLDQNVEDGMELTIEGGQRSLNDLD